MKDRIITALDFDSLKEACDLVEKLDSATIFKVGLQSYISFGEKLIYFLKERKKELFLDLKFKDIPNTVAGAVRSSLKYKPRFLTIHLNGGEEMIKAAVQEAQKEENTNITGVTVLTSMSEENLLNIGVKESVKENVLRLVEIGIKCGVNHFVCSPKEISVLRENFGKEIILLTPGIRPSWSAKGDQKRVFTPSLAISKGTNYMVIGRPITKAKDPQKAFKDILNEIE